MVQPIPRLSADAIRARHDTSEDVFFVGEQRLTRDEAIRVCTDLTALLGIVELVYEDAGDQAPPQAWQGIAEERVNTYTPMLWVTMNEEQRYEEYIRVRKLLSGESPLPTPPEPKDQK